MMIKLADSLTEEELRGMCSVQTADGWFAAVRASELSEESVVVTAHASSSYECDRALRPSLQPLDDARTSPDNHHDRYGTSAVCSSSGPTPTFSSTAALFPTRSCPGPSRTLFSSRRLLSQSTTAPRAPQPSSRTRRRRRPIAGGRCASLGSIMSGWFRVFCSSSSHVGDDP